MWRGGGPDPKSRSDDDAEAAMSYGSEGSTPFNAAAHRSRSVHGKRSGATPPKARPYASLLLTLVALAILASTLLLLAPAAQPETIIKDSLPRSGVAAEVPAGGGGGGGDGSRGDGSFGEGSDGSVGGDGGGVGEDGGGGGDVASRQLQAASTGAKGSAREIEGAKVSLPLGGKVETIRGGENVESMQAKGSIRADESSENSTQGGACLSLAHTELPGDVVRWGADFVTASASECCAACAATARGPGAKCNTWVWCADDQLCGDRHGQCWLKVRENPWADVDLLQGQSNLWTSGVISPRPENIQNTDSKSATATGTSAGTTDPPSAVASSTAHFQLRTVEGAIRLRLREKEAPNSAAWVREVLAALDAQDSHDARAIDDTQAAATKRAARPPPEPDASHPVTNGCRFYRAEPVPKHWGDPSWPDSWSGGRWGPPYALLQGHLKPRGVRVNHAAKPDTGQSAHPVIRRGMVAWAGGAQGPDFFIALASHPEWGTGHTVFAEVLSTDMAVVDAIMARPLRVSNWGAINATELITPLPFDLAPVGPAQE